MAKARQRSAAKAAPAAATAPAEQQGNLPAGSTETTTGLVPGAVKVATTEQTTEAGGAEAAPTVVEPTARTTGQDAHPIVILGGDEIGAYLAELKAAGENLGDLIPLSQLDEPLLRQVGQFVEIEGFAELPSEQLAIQIEAKVGIGAAVTPAPSTGDPDTDTAAPDTAAATSQPTSVAPQASLGDAAVPGADQLDDDGEIEGLWIRAVPEAGFRRLGMRFTREGHGVALSALTDDQVAVLCSDPNLTVEHGVFSGLVE